VARAVQAALAELGESWDVVNIPGRGGANGWDVLAGHTESDDLVAVGSPTLVTNRLLGDGDHRSLSVLPMLCTEAMAFVVRAAGPVDCAGALLDRLRDDPPTVALATARGNINHMAVAMVTGHAGGAPASVPVRVFDSARFAVADLLAGNADIAVVSVASAVPEIESGALLPLAVSSSRRLADPYRAVPTWAELEVPATIGTWRGLVGPPGLRSDVVAAWDRSAARIVETRAWDAAVAAHRWDRTPMASRQAAEFIGGCEAVYEPMMAMLIP
jgi:putative tricarboxylic transport membrane protein